MFLFLFLFLFLFCFVFVVFFVFFFCFHLDERNKYSEESSAKKSVVFVVLFDRSLRYLH